MTTLYEGAFAKINLTLDVLGKRDDGYHEVRMIMQTIQMYDVLEMNRKATPGIVLKTNLPYIPTDEGNLVYRAAKLLMDEFGIRGESTCDELGDEDTREEGACGDDGGCIDGEAHYTAHSLELACTIVVSGNGLHTLIEAHHNHYEEEYHAVGYAVSSDGKVATVMLEALVYNDDHKAGAQVHQEG